MSTSSQVATYIALIAASTTIGYWVGVGSTLRVTRSSDPLEHDKQTESEGSGGEDQSESSEDQPREQLSSVNAGMLEECKLALIVRSDLKMSTGKIAAQYVHASLACFKSLQASNPKLLRRWERGGQSKVTLRCDSEDELMMLQTTAQSFNLCARSIQDAGRTQIAAGSRTVLGIGPGPARLINQVTGKLRLL
ncbi:PTH2-domain-containing protein [Rickenella mellea]|uniref:peptidyl-tRNA hydrolase n=1 Tax=Rickenella mellea TaxID=50990 RepID=A0A4Y7QP43_9AGAM|nr:PTH2-domain-containing protein [Rickenella mellea]